MPQERVEQVPDDGLTPRERRRQPILAVHTGIGKGKSTAAFGMALRAWNAGWPVVVFQFVKSPKWRVGEEVALRELGQHQARTGQGATVTWYKNCWGSQRLARPRDDQHRCFQAPAGSGQVP